MELEIRGHTICEGVAEGEAIIFKGPFSFAGDMNPFTGIVTVPGHELEGQSLTGKVLIFTTGHGSSMGGTLAWTAKHKGVAPAAIVGLEVDSVTGTGVIAAGIPTIDRPDKNPLEVIKNGDHVKVDATAGIVKVTRTEH